jgi:PKD repeat protein
MKKLLLLFTLIGITTYLSAQVTVFSDNFESGTTNWTLSSTWGLSTTSSHSTSHSLTESPTGNYGNNLSNITATMANGVNLSTALSANLSFWAKYNIEAGFDYMYIDVSANGGTSWVNIGSYDGVLNTWTQFNYSLGGYVGNTSVKVRFRFYSDGAVNYDGMYIDDVVITSDTVDNAAPLVLHTPPVFYEGTFHQDSVLADLIDVSGIATAQLKYSVDGGAYSTINGVNTSGDTYRFIIPQQQGGAMVDYFFYVVDSAATPNTEVTDTFSFLSGNYIAYDNGQVDFVDSTGPGSAAAMRISFSSASNLDAILIRNYTDPNRPNDSMLVHIWNSALGVPGTDLITPFKVKPMATLQNTSAMTTIDLRPYYAQLKNLTGDVFIGFSVPSGGVWTTITQPSTVNRSFKYNGTTWTATSGTSGASDFHFRAITSPYVVAPTVNFTADTTMSPTVSFTDLTSPAASTWTWKFGDGATSNLQNPVHTYATYGSFTVWLIATSGGMTDSSSAVVTIVQKAPHAYFIYDTSFTPSILFQDSSLYGPTQWLWDFDDNGATSTQQNPSHGFPAAGGTFNVCLTASNTSGSDQYCENLIIMSTIGFDENTNSDISGVFPNPMQSKAYIEISNMKNAQLSLKVYDMQGRQIELDYRVGTNGIELYRGDMAKGQYIYEIYNANEKIKTGRLIVQ